MYLEIRIALASSILEKKLAIIAASACNWPKEKLFSGLSLSSTALSRFWAACIRKSNLNSSLPYSLLGIQPHQKQLLSFTKGSHLLPELVFLHTHNAFVVHINIFFKNAVGGYPIGVLYID